MVQLRSTGSAGASLPNLTLQVIAHFCLRTCSSAYRVLLSSTGYAGASLPNLTLQALSISFQGSVEKHRLCWGFAFEPYLAGDYTLLFACVLASFRGSVEKHRLCWGFASEPYLAGDCTRLIANFSLVTQVALALH